MRTTTDQERALQEILARREVASVAVRPASDFSDVPPDYVVAVVYGYREPDGPEDELERHTIAPDGSATTTPTNPEVPPRMSPDPITAAELQTMLASRSYTFDLPATIERRLNAAGRRMERDDRRRGVSAGERIDAVRDFEHVLVAMLDRGLDESEADYGLQADPRTGRLSPRHEDGDYCAACSQPLAEGCLPSCPDPVGEVLTFPVRGTHSEMPPRRERRDFLCRLEDIGVTFAVHAWSIGLVLLTLLASACLILLIVAIGRSIG